MCNAGAKPSNGKEHLLILLCPGFSSLPHFGASLGTMSVQICHPLWEANLREGTPTVSPCNSFIYPARSVPKRLCSNLTTGIPARPSILPTCFLPTRSASTGFVAWNHRASLTQHLALHQSFLSPTGICSLPPFPPSSLRPPVSVLLYKAGNVSRINK